VCQNEAAVIRFSGRYNNLPEFKWGFDSAAYVSGSGEGPYEVRWNSPGIKDISLTIDEQGCSSSFSEKIQVTPITSVYLHVSAERDTICSNQSVTFTASPKNFVRYNFYVNSTLMQSSSENQFTGNGFTNGDRIYVKITDINGCSEIISDTLNLTVLDTPGVSLTSSVSNDTICYTDPVIFTASPSGYDLYEFYAGNTLMQSGAGNALIVPDLQDNERVYVRATDKNCVSDRSNSIVTTVKELLPPPQVMCGPSTTSSLEFRWDSVTGATGFEVSLDGAAFRIPLAGSSAVSEFLGGLSAGESHSLVVRAIDASSCGNGMASDTVECFANDCQEIDFDLSNPVIEGCKDDYVKLSIENLNITNYAVQWDYGVSSSNLEYGLQIETPRSLPVTVTNLDEPGCPSVTKSFTIVSTPKPQINLTSSAGNDTICEGSPLKFTVDLPDLDRYAFYDNGLNVQDGPDNTWVSDDPSDGHSIYVKAVDNGCPAFSDTVRVYVDQPLEVPQINLLSSTASTLVFGWEPVSEANGYLVSRDSGPFIIPSSGYTGLSHSIISIDQGNATLLSVMAIGDGACGNSDVSQPAAGYAEFCTPFTFSIDDHYAVCSGDSLTLKITDISIRDYLVTWGSNAPGKSTSLTFVPAGDTVITLTVKNTDEPFCPPKVRYLTINVTNKPEKLTMAGSDSDNEICDGAFISFMATPAGYDHYRFYDNFNLLVEKSINTYDSHSWTNGHKITALGINGGCSGEMSDPLQVTVKEKRHQPQVNCGNSTDSTLSFTWDSIPDAYGYMVSIDGQAYAVPSSGTTGLLHEINGLSGGDSVQVSVIATGSQPCGDSEPSVVKTCYATACNAIDYQIDAYQDVCENEPAELTIRNISATNFSISWNGGAFSTDTSFSFMPVSDTVIHTLLKDNAQQECPSVEKDFNIRVNKIIPVTLSVAGVPGDTVCEGQRLTYLAEPAGFDRYVFYDENSVIQDSSLNEYTIAGISRNNALYAEVFQNGCLTQSDTVHTLVVHPPELHLSASKIGTLCKNEPVKFISTTGFARYVLSDSFAIVAKTSEDTLSLSVNFSSLSVVATDDFGCVVTGTDTLFFNPLPLPEVSLSCSVDTICLGDNTVYYTMPEDLAQYAFYNNGTDLIQWGSSNYYTTDSLRKEDVISVIGIDSAGCQSRPSSSVFPIIHPYPEVTMFAEQEGICLGDSILLWHDEDPAFPSAGYVWSTGDLNDTIRISPGVTTGYVVFYSPGLCPNIPVAGQDVKVDTQEPPVANAGDDVTICITDSIQLVGSGGMRYQWNNAATLSDSLTAEPFASPSVNTTYILTVLNDYCRDVDSMTVFVDLCLEDLTDPVPQIITPNSDGFNDVWFVNHIEYFEKNSLRIFNRWGNQVYSASPYDNTWRGTSNKGIDLPDGTYFYLLDLGNGGEVHKGYIIIHR
ncbi:MAG TPA: gliding motility-associated C-terminal domain-containing protein, partial [Bacteroidales bacterium]|nr:gliding motility-associated C-terminal domain-containing protein [Bacteroidales bacterium]